MSQKRPTSADEPFFLVRSLASAFGPGQELPAHRHDWHQLIFCAAGVMTVWTETGSWVAPASWAVWAPAGVSHAIRFAGPCELRTLYLRPDWARALPPACTAVTVTPLMRELILRAVDLAMLDRREPVHRALARLILDEFRRCEAAPFDLPMPRDAAARQVAADILARPEAGATNAALARQAGLSPRTLERRFMAETGLALGRWRRQARLLGALRRLADGEPVKQVSAACGYGDPSAFVAAFRAAFGETPGRYFRDPASGARLGARAELG